MKTLAGWLERTCCCRHPDAVECSLVRGGTEDDPCECCCHDPDEDDEEE